jgi:predicted nucleic acid-binding protein
LSWVLDASATLAWIFERADPDEVRRADGWLDRILADEAIVSELWHFEVVNGLAVAERRGLLTAADGQDFLTKLDALPIQTVSRSHAITREALLVTARQYGVTAYDAAYLGLAQQHGLARATFDRRLAAAATAAGVALA